MIETPSPEGRPNRFRINFTPNPEQAAIEKLAGASLAGGIWVHEQGHWELAYRTKLEPQIVNLDSWLAPWIERAGNRRDRWLRRCIAALCAHQGSVNSNKFSEEHPGWREKLTAWAGPLFQALYAWLLFGLAFLVFSPLYHSEHFAASGFFLLLFNWGFAAHGLFRLFFHEGLAVVALTLTCLLFGVFVVNLFCAFVMILPLKINGRKTDGCHIWGTCWAEINITDHV